MLDIFYPYNRFQVRVVLRSVVELRVSLLYLVHLSINGPRMLSLLILVEQATLLEEAGDPHKALDELSKKESKIVLHLALICNQPLHQV
jgi:hypothetical protein